MKIFRHFLVVAFVGVMAGFLFSQITPAPMPPNPGGIANGVLLGDTRSPISSLPFTIDRCGSYVVTKCLEGALDQDGIIIQACDVTIDLNGFTITGDPSSTQGNGIAVMGTQRGISVQNGTIRSWPRNGIDAVSAKDCQFSDLRIFDNGHRGIEGNAGCLVADCTVSGQGSHGVVIRGAGIVTNCIARENDHGIQVEGGNGAISSSVASENNIGFGISNCLVTGCSAMNNPQANYHSPHVGFTCAHNHNQCP